MARPSTAGPPRNRDVDFLAFLRQYRARLVGAAFLLHGDAERAERLVQHAVAVAYAHGERFLTISVEQLARADPAQLRLPGERLRRVELIDRESGRADVAKRPELDSRAVVPNASTPVVLSRLDRLSPEARRALVLRVHLELSSAGTGEILRLTPAQVDASVSRSLLELSDLGSPGGGGAVVMMESVTPPAGDVETAAFGDLGRGRQLVRGRRGRGAILALAAILALVLIGIAVWPNPVTVVQVNAPAPAPAGGVSAAPSAAALCTDPKVAACRVELTRDWRYRMAAIITERLDPSAKYFSGYSYGYDSRYDSDALWRGKGGALALDVFSADRGSTDVFFQIATSRATAVRCGATTKHTCIRQQMQDFNYFTMTETSDSRSGVEVQYRPAGTYVITIVVRDTTKGTPLVVDRGAVIELIEDPRLTLPKL